MIETVRDFFVRQKLPRGRGVVAVSGGSDSVALALLLTELCRKGDIGHLAFVHLNHQLRGAESDADEAFVCQLPRRWNVNFRCHSRTLDIAAIARETGVNLEACARAHRYEYFIEVALLEKATWIATGHTADDQAETVLHRLLRGSGLQGLSGIPPRRRLAGEIDVIRPLLKISRADLVAYLREKDQDFRVDSSNADFHYTRNRIRHELLPHLRERYNSAVADVLARLAEQAGQAQEEIESVARGVLDRAEVDDGGGGVVLRINELCHVTDFIIVTLFRLIWQMHDWPMGDMNQPAWQRLMDLARGKIKALDLPGGIHARRAKKVIQIGPENLFRNSDP